MKRETIRCKSFPTALVNPLIAGRLLKNVWANLFWWSLQATSWGGILITKAATMATKINEFFIKKVQDIRSGIPFLPSKFDKCYALMKDRKMELELHHIPVYKVLNILKSMKNSKSTGIDTLDSYSLKIAADVVVHPLHHIICLSIIQSKFPSNWNFIKVTRRRSLTQEGIKIWKVKLPTSRNSFPLE